MIHLFSIFGSIGGGLAILIGLIGKRSQIPKATPCWWTAALLFIAAGTLGIINDSDNDWVRMNHDLLRYLRTVVGTFAGGMTLVLLLVCPRFESGKKVEET